MKRAAKDHHCLFASLWEHFRILSDLDLTNHVHEGLSVTPCLFRAVVYVIGATLIGKVGHPVTIRAAGIINLDMPFYLMSLLG